MKSLSCVRLCPSLCDPRDRIAHQAPPSLGYSRQEYGVGCHFLLQGIFPTRDPTQVSRIPGGRFTL